MVDPTNWSGFRLKPFALLTAPSLAAALQAKPKNMTEEAWVQELNDCILKVWCTLWWGSFG